MLARARWGSRGLDQAVETVIKRAGELTAPQVDELRAVTDRKDFPGE